MKMNTTIKIHGKSHRAVTAGINGYPEPETGCAVFFDSVDALESFADKHDLAICEFKWKAGWSNCEERGNFNPRTYRESVIAGLETEGQVFTRETFDFAEYISANEDDLIAEDDEPDEKVRLKKAIKTWADEIQAVVSKGHVAFKNHNRDSIEDMGECLLDYSEDGATYALGAMIDKERWHINWKNLVAEFRNEEEEEEDD